MTPRLILIGALAVPFIAGCGADQSEAPTDSAAVEARAIQAQATRRRTGAEIQERAMSRVIRTVYLCENGERLSVDFDNPRAMATVRNARGEAIDLFQERVTEGLWYKASAYELRGRGLMATWTADGAPATTCRAVD